MIGGASTLLSRHKTSIDVPERKGSGRINKETGKIWYAESGREYVESKTKKGITTKVKTTTDYETGIKTYTTTETDKKTGITKVVKTEIGSTTSPITKAMTAVKRITNAEDVNSLSSGEPQEKAYADYANKVKAFANQARKTYASTGNLVSVKEAKIKYAPEVARLNNALDIAARNAPKERNAMSVANSLIKAKIQANPNLTSKEIKKIGQQTVYDERAKVGAKGKDNSIVFSDKEWEAIQSGAISDTKLLQILKYADPDKFKERAMPKTTTTLSTASINVIKAMEKSGYTNTEIASRLGKSVSTVSKYINQ